MGFTRENIEEPFPEPEPMQVPEIDIGFLEDYQHFVQQARIGNPMPIENFLNPIEEDGGIEQVDMTDEEIIELVRGSSSSSESSAMEDEDNEPSPYLSLSVKE